MAARVGAVGDRNIIQLGLRGDADGLAGRDGCDRRPVHLRIVAIQVDFLVAPQSLAVFGMAHEQRLIDDADADPAPGDAAPMKLADPKARVPVGVEQVRGSKVRGQGRRPPRPGVELRVAEIAHAPGEIQGVQIAAAQIDLPRTR